MAIIEKERQQAAQKFVQYWKNEAQGNERSETQTFWNSLVNRQ